MCFGMLGAFPGMRSCAVALLIVLVDRRTVYALVGAGAEEMVLFTPS